jgi:LVIVD repeat
VTDLARPTPIAGALVPLADARNVYVARTYAYVSGGRQGLVIVNVDRPEHPRLDQIFTADGAINDLNDVKIGAVDASAFAYLADGRNGLRVLQILSPEDSPTSYGFSPRPTPKLIATYHTHGPALAISKGIDRDRAVDESGNQLAVFGRRGARPFNLEEMQRLYLRGGKLYTVTDAPPDAPRPLRPATEGNAGLLDRMRAGLR